MVHVLISSGIFYSLFLLIQEASPGFKHALNVFGLLYFRIVFLPFFVFRGSGFSSFSKSLVLFLFLNEKK